MVAVAGHRKAAMAEVEFKERAIIWEEHQAIVARELNPERKAFYKLAWHLRVRSPISRASKPNNCIGKHNVISFARRCFIAIMRFDDEVAEIRDLP